MADTPTPIEPATFLREQVAARVARRVAELRADIARLERELDERVGAEATVQLVLEGAGGGTWYLNLRGGAMTVDELPQNPPAVRVVQSVEDWQALARAGLAAQVGGPAGATDITRTRVTRLRALGGAMEFRLTSDEGERKVRLQFGAGDAAEPRCVITVRADDARRLQAGEIPPQMAFMQGLLKLQGDAAFAMQVGAALFL
jgi:hypothetical protein